MNESLERFGVSALHLSYMYLRYDGKPDQVCASPLNVSLGSTLDTKTVGHENSRIAGLSLTFPGVGPLRRFCLVKEQRIEGCLEKRSQVSL